MEKLAAEGSDAGEGIEMKKHETKRRERARQMCVEVSFSGGTSDTQ